MISWHGKIFYKLDRFGVNLKNFWERFRSFFYSHKTLFDLIFLTIYSLEQLALLSLILILPKHASISVGIFIIIFLFTIGVERITMESRTKDMKENLEEMKIMYSELEGAVNEQKTINKMLSDMFFRKKK